MFCGDDGPEIGKSDRVGGKSGCGDLQPDWNRELHGIDPESYLLNLRSHFAEHLIDRIEEPLSRKLEIPHL